MDNGAVGLGFGDQLDLLSLTEQWQREDEDIEVNRMRGRKTVKAGLEAGCILHARDARGLKRVQLQQLKQQVSAGERIW